MANQYVVHVSRINESMHQEPEFDMEAHTVAVNEKGSLSITADGSSRTLSAGLWDSVTISLIRASGQAKD